MLSFFFSSSLSFGRGEERRGERRTDIREVGKRRRGSDNRRRGGEERGRKEMGREERRGDPNGRESQFYSVIGKRFFMRKELFVRQSL